ncbi:MAG: HAD-IC family P-type ATPase [Candidatus Nanopelagicales bacterium]
MPQPPASSAFAAVAEPYAKPADVVLLELQATAEGLSGAEASQRLAEIGPNSLPAPPKESGLIRFLRHFDDVLIYILLISAVFKALIGEWIDCAVIVGVAVINSVIGFIQEGRAESALEGIRRMLSATAEVRRDGEWLEIAAEQLVPGDIVRLRSGDRVPADLRLIEATNLRSEEAALTGEAVPSSKDVRMVEPGAGVGDRTSMLFSSSIVVAGQGIGVVTATGSQAEIGRIQTMLSEVDAFDTPLTRQMTQFGKTISLVILVMAAVMVFIGKVIHDFAINDLVSATIGFAVAAIPEGLPALVTITLALGVQQMAKRNAIIRRLPAVETLGSVTTICSDKTGTLTKNEMTVREVVTAAGVYEVAGIGYDPKGEITREGRPVALSDHPELADLVHVMAVANDADVVPSTEHPGTWALVGEPTEGSLRTLGMKAGFDHKAHNRVAVVPFESEHKLMAVLGRAPDGSRQILIKGAPDRLLDRSERQQVAGGGVEPLARDFWEHAIDELSDQGLRVLAAAVRGAPEGKDTLTLDDLDEGLTFVGVVGIVDPPRPEAIQAIATCQRAGIRVKMITGDHAGTAAAISREMGITTADSAPAITGAQLEVASAEELRAIVNKTDTFARTSPEHKLRLVQALQANGEVVSMTGDGVNDAPALKRADIGVAMGIKGTEATKDAAAVVLADDNFATIECAVEEGRRIYDNLQKSIVFLLPTNGAQSLVILVAVLLGLTLPLAPVQILWVNMVTAVTLSLALAYEPGESDLMTRPPRKPGGSLLDSRYLPRIALASVLIAGATLLVFEVGRNKGWDTATSQTMAVNTLVLAQCAFLFNSRYLRESSLRLEAFTTNPVAWIVVAVLIALQIFFVYVPFMHTWFNSAPVSWYGWLLPLALAVAVFLLVELGKLALRGRERRTS